MLSKLKLAIKNTGVRRVTLSGGVAANSALRAALTDYSQKRGVELFLPPRAMCTDNAAMIAAAGYASYMRGKPLDPRALAEPVVERLVNRRKDG